MTDFYGKFSIGRSGVRKNSLLTVAVLVLALTIGSSVAEAQDKLAFNAADYFNDIGEGFRVADELILAAERDKTGLKKTAAIRLQASSLTHRHQQVRELYGITNNKDVFEKRKRLFLKYLSPIIDSPDKYLGDPDLASTYLGAAESCCTDLVFGLGDGEQALSTAEKVHEAITAADMEPAQRKLFTLMFEITLADILHDTDHYDRATELLLRITNNIQILMDSNEGKDRLASRARLVLPFVAEHAKPGKCRKIAEELIQYVDGKHQNDYRRMLQSCLILQAESYAYRVKPHVEPADRWVSSAKKLLESQFDPAVLSFGSGLSYELFSLQSNLIEHLVQKDIDLAIAEFNRTLDYIGAKPGFNTVDSEDHVVQMAGSIISGLSERDDARARKVWNDLNSFLQESRVKFADRSPIEQVLDQSLGIKKFAYNQFETRASILGKPAPTYAAQSVIYQGTSNKTGGTLDEFETKVVLLEFWNVDCRPCIAGFPHLTQLEEKYGKRGLVVLGVTPVKKLKWDESTDSIKRDSDATIEDESQALVNFARKKNATHRFVLVDHKEHERICEMYGVHGNPAAFLIDRKGNVRESALGSDQIQSNDFEKTIESLLDEP